MNQLVVTVVGGLTLGATFSLIALGLVVVFRATGVLNFAHGSVMLIVAFVVGLWTAKGHQFYLVLAAALAGAALIGAAVYRLILRRTAGMPHFVPLIATMGLAVIGDGVFGIVFGSKQYVVRVPGLPNGVVTVFGARVSAAALTLSAFSIALALILSVVLRRTSAGRRLRAAGQDAVLASQGGINVHKVFMASWAGSAVLAGIAGVCYGASSVADASISDLALAAVPAMLLGGMDSVEGAIMGGLAMGLVQSFTSSYLGGQLTDVVTYGILLVVLLARPEGLFGTKPVRRL